jgi:hypothetical protein
LLVKEGKGFRIEHAVVSFSKSDDLKTFEDKFEQAIETLKTQQKAK